MSNTRSRVDAMIGTFRSKPEMNSEHWDGMQGWFNLEYTEGVLEVVHI